jgi:ABC-type Mn2+/Zn2+ transport system ATPase subunit
MILNIEEKNTTIIVVTHDLEVAKKADRIIFLKDRKISREEIVKSDSVEDVMKLKNSAFGHQIINKEAVDPFMEKLGAFQRRKAHQRRRGILLCICEGRKTGEG